MTVPLPPELLGYTTWHAEDGYHARYDTQLPETVLAAGCKQELVAATPLELTQEGARNRIRIWRWQHATSREIPFTTGDMP